MNTRTMLFPGLLLALSISWFGLVIGAHLQLGKLEPVTIEETGLTYPQARPADALQGAEVYRANGCQQCHTRQVRSHVIGSDIARGWGNRRTVARDYIRDAPVLIGSVRLGPDLANLGLRETNAASLLRKLYSPGINVPYSTMPAYPFLFDVRRTRTRALNSADALVLPHALGPAPGLEIVPREDAHALVAYLLSLKADQLFLEAFPSRTAASITNLPAPANTSLSR